VAIVWQQIIDDTHYEVRSAGYSLRLYTDGVFHSQYNPNHPVTRSIWDLLMLPAFFYPKGEIQRVLVLGVGGGSVIHLLERYVQPSEIVGIELNPIHVSVAKRFFGVDDTKAILHQADAVDWLRDYQGAPFDMIIDDLFGELDGEGERAVALDKEWFTLLNKNLTPHGLLVVNVISENTMEESAYYHNRRVNGYFKTSFRLTMGNYENIIMAFLKKESTASFLRSNIAQVSGLNSRSGPNKLSFQIRKDSR
jgi:spermidine synthase